MRRRPRLFLGTGRAPFPGLVMLGTEQRWPQSPQPLLSGPAPWLWPASVWVRPLSLGFNSCMSSYPTPNLLGLCGVVRRFRTFRTGSYWALLPSVHHGPSLEPCPGPAGGEQWLYSSRVGKAESTSRGLVVGKSGFCQNL